MISYNARTKKYDISIEKKINGERKVFKKRSVSKSKKEAKEIERNFRLELEGKKRRIFFKELTSLYLKELEVDGKAKSSIRTYENLLKNHVYPYFHDKEINRYTSNDISSLKNMIYENGGSSNTINNTMSMLKTIFNFASKEDWLTVKNPLSSFEYLPRTERTKPYYFDYQEFQEFIEIVKRDEEDSILWEAIWTTLFELGLRKSELEPLQVKDVNFDHMTISINKHVIEGQGKIHIAPNRKNSSSIVLPLSDHLSKLLKLRIEELKKYDGFSEDAYIFNCDGIFRPAARTTLKRHLDMIYSPEHPKHTTPHAFRHMCAINLIDLGADSYAVAHHLGDTVEMIEKTYGDSLKWHKYNRSLLNEQNKQKKGATYGN